MPRRSLGAAATGADQLPTRAEVLAFIGGGPVLGFTPGNFPFWRRAMARVRAGIADAKFLVVSDSTGAGTGGGTTPAVLGSWPNQLALALDEVPLLSAARGLGVPQGGSDPDTRWTVGTGWTKAAGVGFGGNCYTATAPSGSLVFADPVLADRYDVYYATNSSLGTLGITASGGSTVSQSTAAASGVSKVTVSAGSASATNTVTITGSGNAVYVIGIEPWLSTTKRVRVGNSGIPGSTTGGWMGGSSTFGGIPSIKAYAPDLTIISLGINDARNNVAPATYSSNMQQLITAARVSGDVLVMAPPACRSDAASPIPANLPAIAAAALALGTPTADLPGRWGTGDAANTLGLMADTIHPSLLGYAEIVQLLLPALTGV